MTYYFEIYLTNESGTITGYDIVTGHVHNAESIDNAMCIIKENYPLYDCCIDIYRIGSDQWHDNVNLNCDLSDRNVGYYNSQVFDDGQKFEIKFHRVTNELWLSVQNYKPYKHTVHSMIDILEIFDFPKESIVRAILWVYGQWNFNDTNDRTNWDNIAKYTG